MVELPSSFDITATMNPDAVELAPLPAPVDFESDMDRPVPFDAGTTVRLDCPDPAAEPWLARHFASWFGA